MSKLNDILYTTIAIVSFFFLISVYNIVRNVSAFRTGPPTHISIIGGWITIMVHWSYSRPVEVHDTPPKALSLEPSALIGVSLECLSIGAFFATGLNHIMDSTAPAYFLLAFWVNLMQRDGQIFFDGVACDGCEAVAGVTPFFSVPQVPSVGLRSDLPTLSKNLHILVDSVICKI